MSFCGQERWLIDRHGKMWRCADPMLSQNLHTTLSGDELKKYTITNMGFVSIEYSGSRLHMRCRPRRVSSLTFASLCYFIADYPWRPIALTLLSDQWATRIYQSTSDVLTELTRLIPGDASPVIFDDCQHAILSAPIIHAKSPLLGKTLTTASQIADDPDHEFLNRVFAGRWSIGHIDTETNRFVFDHMGAGFRRSMLMDTLNDQRYVAWVQKSRNSALSSAEPICEVVDAIVQTSAGSARLCYNRVMLALNRSSGRRLIFSAAVDDASINLRKAS